ncbi:AMP-binding protein [Trinickia sp. LjRoot230]|uniref:AMP-binding protein n=1 Tax=Trinickia sp. LjRoot230 TaxID=3342288 RepID=UPI003ECCA67F
MPRFPLVFHASLDDVVAWRDGTPVPVRAFVADVRRVAALLPAGRHVFNTCADRYRFTVGLCAALVAGKISLLPSTYTPQTVAELATFAPDAFCLHDADDCTVALPRFRFPEQDGSHGDAGVASADAVDRLAHLALVPEIEASRTMAYVFTSGSTGAPVPHRKTWGFLVKNVRAAAKRLGLLDAAGTTIVGTVPSQHMYGFESTVLLALIGGLAFSNRQPFYPLDIRDELEAVASPRVLVTSPVHLRALLMSEGEPPSASLILSATAPLSEKLAAEAEARLGAPLMEIYGSTETGQIATRRTVQGPVWHLLPDVTLQVRKNEAGEAGDAREDEQQDVIWAAGGHVETPVPLGDALELVDGEHFLLHGRKADLVNIAGKRTSLAYLNHQLNAIPGVEDGTFFMPEHDDASAPSAAIPHVLRLMAFVVAPALSARALRSALRERIDAAFMPRPLVFVDTLPRNTAGKLPRQALAALAAQHVGGLADVADVQPIMFDIPANHPALPGHFPGRPIVPGVVLLDYAIARIGAALEQALDGYIVSSAKFLSPAAPGVPLALSFQANDNGTIRFSVNAGTRAVASGVLSAPAPT